MPSADPERAEGPFDGVPVPAGSLEYEADLVLMDIEANKGGYTVC